MSKNIIGYRVLLTRTVGPDDIRYSGSEHNTEDEAEEFVKFFEGYDGLTNIINPIVFNSNHGNIHILNSYFYRNFQIIDHNGRFHIVNKDYYESATSDSAFSVTIDGSLHQALEVVDRKINGTYTKD